MLLTSSDKDTWCSLGCRVAMFQGEHCEVFEGYHGWLLPPPKRAVLAFGELNLEAVKGYILSSLKHRGLDMHSCLI